MLVKKNVESRHLCFVPDLRGKTTHFSPLNMLAVVICGVLYHADEIPFFS